MWSFFSARYWPASTDSPWALRSKTQFSQSWNTARWKFDQAQTPRARTPASRSRLAMRRLVLEAFFIFSLVIAVPGASVRNQSGVAGSGHADANVSLRTADRRRDIADCVAGPDYLGEGPPPGWQIVPPFAAHCPPTAVLCAPLQHPCHPL